MPSIREQLDTHLGRFEALEQQMTDPAILAEGSKVAAVAREHGSLAKVATKYRRFKSLVDEVAELKRMSRPFLDWAGTAERNERSCLVTGTGMRLRDTRRTGAREARATSTSGLPGLCGRSSARTSTTSWPTPSSGNSRRSSSSVASARSW